MALGIRRVPNGHSSEEFRMSKLSRVAVLAAGLAILPALGHADELALNIEPGLWEMTSTPHMSGAIPDTSNLTADQRAKLEAAMGKAMQPRSYRECLSREKLQHAFDRPQAAPASCQRTIVTNSPAELQMRIDCSDAKGTHQMTVHMQAPGSQTLTGTVNIDATRNGKTMTILNNLQGKWVAADCGSVTDIQPMN
jgi:Spy/CpxP family protein refolding chaperone